MCETKKQQFTRLCKSLANMESLLNDFQNIGILLEPDEKIGHYVYNTCDNIFNVVKSLLNVPNGDEDDWLHDKLMSASLDTMDKVMTEVWEKYGTD